MLIQLNDILKLARTIRKSMTPQSRQYRMASELISSVSDALKCGRAGMKYIAKSLATLGMECLSQFSDLSNVGSGADSEIVCVYQSDIMYNRKQAWLIAAIGDLSQAAAELLLGNKTGYKEWMSRATSSMEHKC